MSRTHLVIPDGHAHPDFHNKRAEWLGALIADVKPDVVINIGDVAEAIREMLRRRLTLRIAAGVLSNTRRNVFLSESNSTETTNNVSAELSRQLPSSKV